MATKKTCDCDEPKDCCGCLKGGCDCVCDCDCHKDRATDPCFNFPRLTCPVCVAAEKARDKKMDEEEAEELRRYNANLPSDAEIRRILG